MNFRSRDSSAHLGVQAKLALAARYFTRYDFFMGVRKVLIDTQGRYFCGFCGATRKRTGELFAQNYQSALAHLKHCKGEAGIEQERQDIRDKLASGPIPRPEGLPAGLPQDLPQDLPHGTARSSSSLPAAGLGSTYRPAPLRPAGSLPAETAPAEFVTREEFDQLRDELNLALIERDEYRKLAEEAVAHNENHTPHLALAQAQTQESASPWPWILGAGVFGLIVYGLVSSSSDAPDSRPSMSGATRKNSRSSGVGDLLDLGSKGLNFFSKARSALKI